MAGARIEFTSKEVEASIAAAKEAVDNPAPLYQEIIEYLTRIHKRRFKAQVSPDGIPWQPLSPRYLKRKRKKKNQILTYSGALQNTLRGQHDADGIEFGTNRVYGAIHHFGGEINNPGGTRTLNFRLLKSGAVKNRFVKKDKSNFEQDVQVSGHKIKIPKRPWLGTSKEDDDHILKITLRWMQKHIRL